jgi:hypothetical protein
LRRSISIDGLTIFAGQSAFEQAEKGLTVVVAFNRIGT